MSYFECDKSDKILLLGEGNFSFSSCLLKHLTEKCGISNFSNLYVTCFQTVLSPVALENVNFLKTQGAEVLLGVDATKLEDEGTLKFIKFNKIIFNFPHVGGKMKIHLNRELLCKFFVSCSDMLTKDGNVIVTLCSGQGGTGFETSRRRWDDTWQIVEQAAHGSFVLSDIDYFPYMMFNDYQPVGYRGREQKFSINSSVLHVFCKVPFPKSYIDGFLIQNVSNYHPVESNSGLTVSYAHKLAILKNPLMNQRSLQCFLIKKLNDFVRRYLKDVEVDLNLPYHTDYNLEKASCFFEGSLYSLRSSLLEVTPKFYNNFVAEGLVFQKFGSDFSNIGASCQAIVGGSLVHLAIKDFFEFVQKTLSFDGNITIEENESEWFVYLQSNIMSRKKVAYNSLQCFDYVTVDIDCLCLFLFHISAKQLWANDTKFNDVTYKLSLPSLYPQEFCFDVSFASKYDLDENKFFHLLHQIPDNLIDSVILLSVYQHPTSVEKSYCYRLKYKSYEKPLYRKLVIDIHHNVIRKLLENILHVTVH